LGFLPEQSSTILAMKNSFFCQDLLKKYGSLLSHDAKNPNHPPKIQKQQVTKMFKEKKKRKEWNSIYLAGTMIRMKANAIHAGPPSDEKNCRAIFFIRHHLILLRHSMNVTLNGIKLH
jgi:hypothetical protein